MTPEDFISAIAPDAMASARDTQVPASFTIAEAALESGWGNHAPGHNLFGVKADARWDGPTTEQRTREFIAGTWTMTFARFRAYDDWLGSMRDHAGFLRSNPRYSRCFEAADSIAFTRRVAVAGYATDPKYAEDIIAIINQHGLQRFDPQPEGDAHA